MTLSEGQACNFSRREIKEKEKRWRPKRRMIALREADKERKGRRERLLVSTFLEKAGHEKEIV